jgi:V/A-type H+-transporting ATPase subunit B
MPDLKNSRLLSGREYIGVDKIDGPLIFIRKTHPVGYRELIECVDKNGHVRLGIVLESSTTAVVAQVFEGTSGLTLPGTRVRFSGEPLTISVSKEMLGRVFNGLGRPIDGGPPQRSDVELDVNGMAINPTARQYPRDFVQTGISVIDGMNTLIRGQKLPIFSGNGLPHNELAAQIARRWASSTTSPSSLSARSKRAACSTTSRCSCRWPTIRPSSD